MTATAGWSGTDLATAVAIAASRVTDAAGELGRLDAQAGDGDLGTSLTTGFAAASAAADDLTSPDPAAVLTAVGRALATKAPSTMGTLLGTVFLRAAGAVTSSAVLDGAGVAALLETGSAAVEQRGGVGAGQRTVLDALLPSAAAARSAADSGHDLTGVLAAAARAADEGARATAAMEPQVGRAGWIPDRARGHVDAGAAAWAVIMRALADAAGAPGSHDD
ncbi:DAK2 domain-containing protein [Jiangella asiatica]|uniref:DAK2 domain-containing protein n=1 Tax=Jiangella asiatica TaxID=2530372 RepID=A0A4R5CVS3_9ACTN|nr:DAK2 domain-containing protein [Jiangella asiatica]TDE03121.1 DAK2 domain-containing protein [Jiangella asiatica]